MATDSTPATTVQNMLNGIDYSALIGGPLQAAISAQVMAILFSMLSRHSSR